MKQVLCAWFPNWPIQRMVVARPELKRRAAVLYSSAEGRLPSVTACCDRAARRGVRVGMPLAEARALVPSGWFAAADPAADDEQLRRLAWSCQRFTPRAGLEEADQPECLFLDVTGCATHFGGLRRLGELAAESFRARGYHVRVAAAPTFGAAWAAAHAINNERGDIIVLDDGRLQEALSPLPGWGLRLPRETLSLLAECGLETIGQLLGVLRSSLPSRFGPELLLRLDQALGSADEPLTAELPPRPIRAEARFEFPLENIAAVAAALQPLLRGVFAELKRRGGETQRLRVGWKREAGAEDGFDVRLLRPTAAADRFAELLPLQLERRQFTGGIVLLKVEATACRAAAARRLKLFDRDDEREAEFFHLIERLGSRLGAQAVVRARLLPEAEPERAVFLEPWLSSAPDANDETREEENDIEERPRPRPLRLLATPLPLTVDEADGTPRRFRWRRQDHVAARCEGPERIETGWWRSAMIRRDYYRVETTAGARFWLFRELTGGNWFVHGTFD